MSSLNAVGIVAALELQLVVRELSTVATQIKEPFIKILMIPRGRPQWSENFYLGRSEAPLERCRLIRAKAVALQNFRSEKGWLQ